MRLRVCFAPTPTQRALVRATTPVGRKIGLVGDARALAMSVSELKQIISTLVIVCGVLAAVVLVM